MTTTITLYDTRGDLVPSPKPIDYMLYATESFDVKLKYVEETHHPISKFFENAGDSELFFISLWQEKVITPETKQSVMPYFDRLFRIWLNDRVDYETRPLVQLLDNESRLIKDVFVLFRSYIHQQSIPPSKIHLLATLCVELDRVKTFNLLQLGQIYSVFRLNSRYMPDCKTAVVWMKSGKTYRVKNINIDNKTKLFIKHIDGLRHH